MSEQWWCCSAPHGEHDDDCPNRIDDGDRKDSVPASPKEDINTAGDKCGGEENRFCYRVEYETVFHGSYESRKAAIDAAREDHPICSDGLVVYTARCAVGFTTRGIAKLSVPRIVECLSETAYDEIGDASEDWPDVAPEDEDRMQEELAEAFVEIACRYVEDPRFWETADEIRHRIYPISGLVVKPQGANDDE